MRACGLFPLNAGAQFVPAQLHPCRLLLQLHPPQPEMVGGPSRGTPGRLCATSLQHRPPPAHQLPAKAIACLRSHVQAQTGGAEFAMRTLPELAMARLSIDNVSAGSDSEDEEQQQRGAASSDGNVAQAGPVGPAFAG